jgi:hypothetical protein
VRCLSEDAEAKLGVFIEDLALRHIVAEVGGDEVVVLQHLLQERAYLLPSGRARVGCEDAMTVGSELLERVSHEYASFPMSFLASKGKTTTVAGPSSVRGKGLSCGL